jgi:oxygen-independent coproporphyrinogen-3 oxidase
MMEAREVASGSPYVQYLYGYPHKTAYRPLTPPIALDQLWQDEKKDALFLYLHVPFCEMRCGFCNLFTTPRPRAPLVSEYLAALARQARVVRAALGDVEFARVAIGGGTPTLLEPQQLEQLFNISQALMGADLPSLPMSVETSPETARPERLKVLRERGVTRVSIGVQSFDEREVHAVNRPQRTAEVHAALELLRHLEFPTLNIDLMYGLPGQTRASFLESLRQALVFTPEELYLYPLYVRPLTTLGRRGERAFDDARLELYRAGRDFLVAAGYRQKSMRMFRLARAGDEEAGPVYACQEDGMVGLGCGARSYAGEVHYASEWAVGARGVKDIISHWIGRGDAELAVADYGVRLDDDDRRRRHAILSLLAEGLDRRRYRDRFKSDVLADLPQIGALAPLGLVDDDGVTLRLTAAGLERADAIGPFLHSPRVAELMRGYELR